MTPSITKINGPSTSGPPNRASQTPSQPRKILPLGNPPPSPQVPVSPANSYGARQVLRVNRACNACRKQKMRCEGPDNPPCARCRASGAPCIFEKVSKPDAPDTNGQRITDLENRWTAIEGTLTEVLQALRDVRTKMDHLSMPQPQQPPLSGNGSNEQPTSSGLPHSPSHGSGNRSSAAGSSIQHNGAAPYPSPSSATSQNSLPPINQMLGKPQPHKLESPLNRNGGLHGPISLPLPTPTPTATSHPHLPHSYSSAYPSYSSKAPTSSRLPPRQQTDPSSARRMRPVPSSAVNSANNSDDEGELPSAALAAPISVLTDIAISQPEELSDDEAMSTESERSGRGRRGSPGGGERASHSQADHSNRRRTSEVYGRSSADGQYSWNQAPLSLPAKRKRGISSSGDQDVRARLKGSASTPKGDGFLHSPLVASRGRLTDSPEFGRGARSSFIAPEGSVSSSGSRGRRYVPTRRELDVVEQTLITEDEARALYEVYFSGCHRLLAVFDPSVDTYESIKERSPFLLCALLMVGAKVRDGANPPSETQKKLMAEATRLAKDRVFEVQSQSTDEGLGDVQALLLMAGWSHTMRGVGWLTAGHAIRVAVELGINKALLRLEKRKQAGKNTDNDRTLVNAARTWLALYVFEYQISFGTGRPAMMRADAAITTAKAFLLTHPLSIVTDARLVSTCDLLTRQSIIHENLERRAETEGEVGLFRVLQDATKEIEAWLEEWDHHMNATQPAGGFFRSSAAIQRSYAHLFHNSIALQNIKTVGDVQAISPEMRQVAMQAISAAKECVNICLINEEYRIGLKYAVAYTHTCAAFAGAFLLRFARLFPEDVDMQETTEMVESLADILNEVPAQRFALCLRKMLNHTKIRILRNKALQQQQRSNAVTGLFGDSAGVADVYNDVSNGESPHPSTSRGIPLGSSPKPPLRFIEHHQHISQAPSDLFVNHEVRISNGGNHLTGSSALTQGTTPNPANSHRFTNDFAHLVHPTSSVPIPNTASSLPTQMLPPQQHMSTGTQGMSNSGHQGLFGMDEAPFFEAAMGTVLEGFFGDGHDWAPWISTSIGGDLGLTMQTPLSVDLTATSFPWNTANQL